MHYNIVVQYYKAAEQQKMSYIFGEDRTQTTISSLDEMISPDNSVRLIDLLVDKLILEYIAKYSLKGTGTLGRPAYHPKHMLKLYVYGYMNKISSSRRLEAESKRNVELKWLINNVSPDFKTIADFRRDNSDAIKELTLRFRYMLSNKGLITAELMALDGTKVKANAGAKEISKAQLSIDMQAIESEIEKYMILLHKNDIADDVDEIEIKSGDSAERIADKIAKLEACRRRLQDLQKEANATKRGKVNPTDPESRMMSGRKESFSGYNLQVIVDSIYKLIASAQITQSLNDRQEMIPALENLKETLDIEPDVLLADNGYDNVLALQKIESEGKTEALVMVGGDRSSGGGFKKSAFTYDEDADCYYCPMGHALKRRGGIQKRKDRYAAVYQCSKKTCDACPHRGKCKNSKHGRTITRYTDEKWVESYHRKVLSPESRALLRRRKAIVEHVFGVIKCWMGKIPLLLRGKQKVQTEINLYTTAYNLKRLIKLLGFEGVVRMMDAIPG